MQLLSIIKCRKRGKNPAWCLFYTEHDLHSYGGGGGGGGGGSKKNSMQNALSLHL